MQSVYIYEQDFYNIKSEYELKNKLYSLGVPFKNPITLELDDKFKDSELFEQGYEKDNG